MTRRSINIGTVINHGPSCSHSLQVYALQNVFGLQYEYKVLILKDFIENTIEDIYHVLVLHSDCQTYNFLNCIDIYTFYVHFELIKSMNTKIIY